MHETAPPAAVSWTSFTEPTENAFTAEVPQGWRVNAGVVRASATAAWPWLSAASPDGGSMLFIGDPDVPILLVNPGAMFGATQEGQQIPGAGGAPNTVMSYRTGAQFAQMYGAFKLATQCSGTKLLGAQARTDLAEIAQRQSGPQVRSLDSGEASFACTINGKAYEARIYATTVQFSAGMWSARVMGLHAPRGQAPGAEQVLFRVAASTQVTPQWTERMREATAAAMQAQNSNWNQFGQNLRAAQVAAGQATLARGEAFGQQMQASHEAYISAMSQEADARAANFAVHEYNKQVQADNMILMINNEHLEPGPDGPVAVHD